MFVHWLQDEAPGGRRIVAAQDDRPAWLDSLHDKVGRAVSLTEADFVADLQLLFFRDDPAGRLRQTRAESSHDWEKNLANPASGELGSGTMANMPCTNP